MLSYLKLILYNFRFLKEQNKPLPLGATKKIRTFLAT